MTGELRSTELIYCWDPDGPSDPRGFARADHRDHIHVGWRPLYGQSKKAAKRIDAILRPRQWIKLIDRLGEIDNPEVREAPSKFSVKVVKNASSAHSGE